MKQKIYNIAVVLLIILAIIIRIINWPNSFGDINCDEAMLAINARSISENGTDIYGTSFPVYFEAWLNSGQSALSTYITAFSILIFGFNLFAIRLPMLIISIVSIFIVFLLTKKIFNKEIAIISLLLIVINPWHIMQSQWNLDCNLFPHLILIGIYLLYIGIENKKSLFLYLSMLVFGLSMYSYGISIYFVPLFLLVTGIYLLKTKQVRINQFFVCCFIYLLVFLPLLIMYIINYFELETINIGVFTIQRFMYQVRTNDMLIFSENILEQLKLNILSLFRTVIIQNDFLQWNSIKEFGTLYLFSIFFIIIGIIDFNKASKKNSKLIMLWLILSLLTGILVNKVNINRLNIIWYPLIILAAYGVNSIYQLIKNNKVRYIIMTFIGLFYIISFIMFSNKFYGDYQTVIKKAYTFSNGFVQAIEFINNLENKEIIVSELANTSGHYVYYRFSLNYDYTKRIPKQELLVYHLGNREKIDWFNNDRHNFKTISLKNKQNIEENVYLIRSNEKKYIVNIQNYTEHTFGKYSVLVKK